MARTLSPTLRSTLSRHRERAHSERSALFETLSDALVCHVGTVTDGHPVVLPMAFGVDPEGPDDGGTLYLHGSVASPALLRAAEQELCVTITCLDGLVLARSAFHHSMNYRSAVVFGRPRRVTDAAEKERALTLVVDQVVPGRSHTLRANTRKELAATLVLALPLAEASVKSRSGPPNDDETDIATVDWAGVLPLRVTAGPLQTARDARAHWPPADVRRRVATLSVADDFETEVL
jgi:hypothetical protein